MSTSPMLTLPDTMVVPGRAKPSRAIATVVLPDPDSPTMPSAAPGPTEKPISATMSTFAPTTSTRRFSTRMPSALDDSDGLRCVLEYARNAAATVAVEYEVDADRKERDCNRRYEYRPGLHSQGDAVLADHQAPVGG